MESLGVMMQSLRLRMRSLRVRMRSLRVRIVSLRVRMGNLQNALTPPRPPSASPLHLTPPPTRFPTHPTPSPHPRPYFTSHPTRPSPTHCPKPPSTLPPTTSLLPTHESNPTSHSNHNHDISSNAWAYAWILLCVSYDLSHRETGRPSSHLIISGHMATYASKPLVFVEVSNRNLDKPWVSLAYGKVAICQRASSAYGLSYALFFVGI